MLHTPPRPVRRTKQHGVNLYNNIAQKHRRFRHTVWWPPYRRKLSLYPRPGARASAPLSASVRHETRFSHRPARVSGKTGVLNPSRYCSSPGRSCFSPGRCVFQSGPMVFQPAPILFQPGPMVIQSGPMVFQSGAKLFQSGPMCVSVRADGVSVRAEASFRRSRPRPAGSVRRPGPELG